MPCFSHGPNPGTPQFEEWEPEVRRKLDAFTHVVDYYHQKAGLSVPHPETIGESHRDWWRGRELPCDSIVDVSPEDSSRVLHQILLHLDCDDVDVFDLNDIRNLIHHEETPQMLGYVFVLQHCFHQLRAGFHNRPTTAAQWNDCTSLELMLDCVVDRVSDRKLRLFSVGCCRIGPGVIDDERSHLILETAERVADGIASEIELRETWETAVESEEIRGIYGPPPVWVASPSVDESARYTAWNIRRGNEEEEETIYLAQADLLRCVIANPFLKLTFDEIWRTETVLALARQMYDSRDFSAMSILGDALIDAGCELDTIIQHCQDTRPHVRGCWVVDLILNLG